MPIHSPRDLDAIHPSIYRGITKIAAPPPGQQKYIFYDKNGMWIGEVHLANEFATPESEQLVDALYKLNDPAAVADPRAHLRLEA